jgi:drug/metabolite transporter (DMT)-like permease
MLLGVTVIWGATFFWMKQALGAAEAQLGKQVASGLFVTLRFGLASLLLPLISRDARKLGGFTLGLVRDAGLLGLLLLVGFLIQMIALADITPAVSAFLTSLYVIFTAFLSLFFARHRHISPALLFGVLLATLGAAFISGPPQLNFDTAEWLTVLCAFLFAGSILTTDHATRTYPPGKVSQVSFATVALGAGLFLAQKLMAENAPTLAEVASVMRDPGFLVPLLSCSLLATLIALTLLNHFQRYVSPVRAATLYSLEPVWGAAISVGLGADTLNPWLLGGAGALLAGNLVAEFGPKSK